jgi:hypothetical protein
MIRRFAVYSCFSELLRLSGSHGIRQLYHRKGQFAVLSRFQPMDGVFFFIRSCFFDSVFSKVFVILSSSSRHFLVVVMASFIFPFSCILFLFLFKLLYLSRHGRCNLLCFSPSKYFVSQLLASAHGLREFSLPSGERHRLRYIQPWNLNDCVTLLKSIDSPFHIVNSKDHKEVMLNTGGIDVCCV